MVARTVVLRRSALWMSVPWAVVGPGAACDAGTENTERFETFTSTQATRLLGAASSRAWFLAEV